MINPPKETYPIVNNILLFQKGPLSQWYGGFKDQESTFEEHGRVFNCAEKYMMYEKAYIMGDTEAEDLILSSNSPKEQKEIGRRIRNFDQVLWDTVKFEVVVRGNYLKFSQNEHLKEFLFQTNGLILAEAAPWDPVWGIGLDEKDKRAYNLETWQGESLLGKALMYVRETLSHRINIDFDYLRHNEL